MAKINEELLVKKLKSINRGAYWFGIIGRLSIVVGALFLFIGLVGTYGSGASPNGPVALLSMSLSSLINGWLFLMGRDAFEAIAYLIEESEKTV